MGCAEAKYDTKDKVRKHLTMQPAWDALRQRHSATVTAAGADDATRMGCAEDWSVSRAYISHESIVATLTTVA